MWSAPSPVSVNASGECDKKTGVSVFPSQVLVGIYLNLHFSFVLVGCGSALSVGSLVEVPPAIECEAEVVDVTVEGIIVKELNI